MLPRVDSSIRPVTSIEAPSAAVVVGDPRQQALQRATQLVIGRQLQGEILSRLNDGSFLVKIAGTAARMVLPADTRVGSSLPMTLVSTDPRPVFLLGTDASTAGLGGEVAAHPAEHFLTTAQQAGTASSAVNQATQDSYTFHQTGLNGAESGAASTTLSRAGRLIANLLHAARQSGAPTAVLGKSPLVNAPTVGAARIAEALQGAVETS